MSSLGHLAEKYDFTEHCDTAVVKLIKEIARTCQLFGSDSQEGNNKLLTIENVMCFCHSTNQHRSLSFSRQHFGNYKATSGSHELGRAPHGKDTFISLVWLTTKQMEKCVMTLLEKALGN
jgi:hypothetical protein